MQTRKLGWTDLELTTIGLGTWAMGGGGWQYGWGPQDEKNSIDAILRAVDQGVNWVDTAPVYGFGTSEEVVGKALKLMTTKPIVATKCGRVEGPNRTVAGNLKADAVRQECEDSLRRLSVDVIDLYQIHWPDPIDQVVEGWEAIAGLIEEGKVRYGAVSNFNPEQMERLRPIQRIASNQPPYSMVHREIEERILPYCAEHEIGTVAYSPMQKGLLTGAVTRERMQTMDEDDHRRKDPMFNEPQLSVNLELVEGLKRIAERNGKTPAQLAVAWVLRRPEVTSAIVGARRPDQVDRNAPAGDWHLSCSDIDEIEELLETRRKAIEQL